MLLFLLSCQRPCEVVEVTAGATIHQSTLHLRHDADVATLTLWLDDEPAGTHTLVRDGDVLSVTLNGLPPLVEATFEVDADTGRRCQGSLTTGNLPPSFPTLTRSLSTEQARAAPLLLGTLMGETAAVFMVDRQGRVRWHHLVEEGGIVSDVHLVDGTVLYNRTDQERTDDIGEVRSRTLLGEEGPTTRTEWGHHVFAPLPDGGLAWPALDVRTWTDPDSNAPVDVVGDRIETLTGTVFSVWDAEDPVINPGNTGFYALGYDWSHANALQAMASGYLLSLGHLDAVYDLDTDGTVRARYHPDQVISGTPWRFQHDANLTEAGTLLLVSHEDSETVAREYEITDDGLVEVWSQPGPLSGFLGQARRLSGGNTLINFGGKGILREVTDSGEIVWQLESGLGTWFGNVVLIEDVLGTVAPQEGG